MSTITQHLHQGTFFNEIEVSMPVLVWYASVDLSLINSPHLETTGTLYTDLLLSGTKHYTRTAFLDAINTLGASISVSYTAGRVTIQVTSSAAAAPAVHKLVTQMMNEPTFASKELSRAKTVLCNNLELSKEDARSVAHDMLYQALYPKEHLLYSHEPTTLIAETKKVTIGDIKAFHALVREHRATVTVAGDASLRKRWHQLAQTLFKGVVFEVLDPLPMKPAVPRVLLKEIPSKENVEFSIGTEVALTVTDPAYPALMVGVAILGKWGGFTGRLMQRIREKQGLTYGIYARMAEITKDEPGLLRIMSFFAPDKAERGISETLKEYRLIIEKGVTKDELERFKLILRTQFVLLHDMPTSLVATVHSFACDALSYDEVVAWYDVIDSLTAKEVNTALKKYLDPRRVIIAGAGPTAGLTKKLEALL